MSRPRPAGRAGRQLAGALVAAGLGVAGCGSSAPVPAPTPVAHLEHVAGATRVVLSRTGADRIGIRTNRVRRAGARRTEIPYSAVLYAPDGRAWTYTSPAALQYVRRQIVIDRVAGGSAILRRGPPPGTPVVTRGADELLGTEQGVEG